MACSLHIHLDSIGGIAGDMFVAAMLDALPGLEERVLRDLVTVLPEAAGRAEVLRGGSGGLSVRRFRLVPAGEAGSHEHGPHEHGHAHPHPHLHTGDHSHEPASPAMPELAGGGAGRQRPVMPVHYSDLAALIQGARLARGTAEAALAILHRLAEAEGRVHGVPLEDVHFHEIADWDSLMDVVAAGSIAAAVEGATWSVSSLPRGGGQVRTRHGLMPVPAPATTQLLLGFLTHEDGLPGERVTPTGAAILAHLVDPDARPPEGMRLTATGLGAGTRELQGMPNVLRALIWEAVAFPAGRDEVSVLAFDVDDMSGEEIGVAAERLRTAEGVLDLSLAQRFGKKSRPLTEFRLLVAPAHRDAVAELCLSETSTIGVRWHTAQRCVLARRADMAEGAGGRLRRKLVGRPAGQVTVKVESDDLAGLDGLAARRRAARQAEDLR